MRELTLAPLPERPEDTTTPKPALLAENNTASDEAPSETAETKSAPAAPRRGLHDRYIAPEMQDWTRVYRIGHNLLLPASLNKSEEKMFILDTGAFSTTVSPEVARLVTKVRSNDNMRVKGISGKVDNVFSADSITFRFAHLSQRIEDVASFSTASLSKSLGMDVAGLIGITALGQLKIDIDYRDGLVNMTYDANRGHKF
jgi:hypothetical protein